MNNNIKFIKRLGVFVLIILCTACGKDIDKFTPDLPTGSTEDIINAIAEPAQIFIENAENEIIIQTILGTVIVLPKGILVDETDNNNISGEVKISVIEVKDKGDMIRNNLNTATSSSWLISERMLNITVKKDDTFLKIKEGKQYKIYIPNALPDSDMKLFYGENSDLGIIWNEAEERDIVAQNEWFFQVPGGIITDFGYELSLSELNWINVDKYQDIPEDQKVKVSISLPEGLYTQENSMVFMIIEEDNSAIRLQYNGAEDRFEEPYGATPMNKSIKLVVIAAMNEQEFHFKVKSQKTTEVDKVHFIVPESKTKDEINRALKSL